eukprot:GHVH01009111.1.p1 GENE.GHVH01009111.1~~GHVH01009111.1.p1  ORF type:complete len:834 (+),score=86.26 GHVH01009111.1:2026-4527(+)
MVHLTASTSTTSSPSALREIKMYQGHDITTKDMTTLYVMGACIALLAYSLAILKTARRSINQCDRNGIQVISPEVHHVGVRNDIYKARIWAFTTITFKIASLLILVIFEVCHLMSSTHRADPSPAYIEFYRSTIGPILFLPIVVSDMLSMSLSSVVNKLTSTFTLIQKRKSDHYGDCYRPPEVVRNGHYMNESCDRDRDHQASDDISSKYSGQLFNPANDSLGIMYVMEIAVRSIVTVGASVLICVEILLFFCACFGTRVPWLTLVVLTLSQILILGVVCAILKMSCWCALMAAMGFEVFHKTPFSVVEDNLSASLTRGLVYVLFRLVTYLGSVQMLSSYHRRLVNGVGFQRVDGDSIIFFFVLDTASLMTASLWIRFMDKFVNKMEATPKSFFESGEGISMIDPAWPCFPSTASLSEGVASIEQSQNDIELRSPGGSPEGKYGTTAVVDQSKRQWHHCSSSSMTGTKVVTLDSRAGRLCSMEFYHQSTGVTRHIIRRFVSRRKDIIATQLLTETFLKLSQFYESLPSFIRGMHIPVLDVRQGHTTDEIWVVYQWPGDGWYPPAYWLAESEYSCNVSFTLSLVLSIVHAVGELDLYRVSHGHLDPNVSILMRPLLTDNGTSFDVLFVDWGFDLMNELNVTCYATQNEMRLYAESAPWIAENVWCCPMKNNDPTSFNSGLKWVSPEALLRETHHKKGITLYAHPDALPDEYTPSSKSSKDSYFVGLLIWVLAMRITKQSDSFLSPYEGLMTDEETILKVVNGSRPNISRLREANGFWGSDALQKLLKCCLAKCPYSRPSPTIVYSILAAELDSEFREDLLPERTEVMSTPIVLT